MVNKFRRALIDDTFRLCSWEECEAPENLPRTLVDTTLHELVRFLPLPFRRIPVTSWGDRLGDFLATLAHVPQILEKTPVFLWGKLPCHDALFLLLKLDYPKTEYFQWTPSQTTYTFVHNCASISLRGILTDGVIRPSSWKGEGESNSEYFPSLGFYCRCCYPGHSHNSDNRINPDITHRLTPELQCALRVACTFGGRTASRRYFVAGECFSRQFQHYVVRSGDSLVIPSPATSTMLCGIGLTRGTSVALLPVKFNMLDCSFGQMSSPLMAFDVLIFLYDYLIPMYYILLAALRQLVAIFCHWSSLPTEKGPKRIFFPFLCFWF